MSRRGGKRRRRRPQKPREQGGPGAGEAPRGDPGRGEDEPEQGPDDEEEERLPSGQRYLLLVIVLLILGAGVIFIDKILAWVMGLLGWR